MLNRLQDAKIWSTIDLKMAYHQILVAPQSRHLTSFVVPGKGIFDFITMPFGLKSAGATFQCAISQVITSDLAPNAMAYLDDIIVCSFTWKEHLKWLRLVIQRILSAGFSINRDNYFFGKK